MITTLAAAVLLSFAPTVDTDDDIDPIDVTLITLEPEFQDVCSGMPGLIDSMKSQPMFLPIPDIAEDMLVAWLHRSITTGQSGHFTAEADEYLEDTLRHCLVTGRV